MNKFRDFLQNFGIVVGCLGILITMSAMPVTSIIKARRGVIWADDLTSIGDMLVGIGGLTGLTGCVFLLIGTYLPRGR